MPNNVYSEIHLHFTWHTRTGAAIDSSFERNLHAYLRDYAERSPDVHVHAVGGVADHVHLAVTVPPTLAVSDWLGKLKGASAHHVNRRLLNRRTFAWQAGYGVVSFGTKDLTWVVEYIKRQKEHHASGNIHDRLERWEEGRGLAAAYRNQP